MLTVCTATEVLGKKVEAAANYHEKHTLPMGALDAGTLECS